MMDQNMMQAMSVLQSENGIAKMMLKPVYDTGYDGEPNTSQAELVADLFNIERLDVKRLGEAAGVDISIQKMTPETAAMLLQAMVRQESLELIEKFNELENKRETILTEMLSEEEMETHREMKRSIAYSVPEEDVKNPPEETTPEPAEDVPTSEADVSDVKLGGPDDDLEDVVEDDEELEAIESDTEDDDAGE